MNIGPAELALYAVAIILGTAVALILSLVIF